jgi:N-acetylmuramoyl-L-alanine amidase
MKNRPIFYSAIISLILVVSISLFWAFGFAKAQGFGGQLRPKIYAVQIENTANGNLSLNIRTDRDFKVNYFSLPNPTPRLVIDIPKVDWKINNNASGQINGIGVVKKIRYADKSDKESRIVLDLSSPAKVISQNIISNINGKILKIEIGATNNDAFAQNTPKTNNVARPLAFPSPISPKYAGKKYVIVIDAGHGANDPGALGYTKGVYEKQVTLASALALRDILKRDPRFTVIMTRENDTFLELEKRIIIARDIRADLFISLHADSAPQANAEGATVYTLSESGGDRSRKLLNRDNWTVVPPNRSRDNNVTEILRDLTQRDTKNQSAIFAENIIRNLRGIGPLTSSSHRRAGFFVLLSPTTPAVLFEMGFITSQKDEARLINPAFRSRQMAAVATSIKEYFDNLQMKNK